MGPLNRKHENNAGKKFSASHLSSVARLFEYLRPFVDHLLFFFLAGLHDFRKITNPVIGFARVDDGARTKKDLALIRIDRIERTRVGVAHDIDILLWIRSRADRP